MTFTTCLWFDGDAHEAAIFYCSVFENSRINSVTNYPEGIPGIGGTPMTVEFEINGQPFLGLNAGPSHPHSDAISFQIPCKNQTEIDHYWEKLTADGGEPGQCGWCRDKYGVAWQVVTPLLGQFFGNPETAGAVSAVLQQQTKIVIAELEAAAQG